MFRAGQRNIAREHVKTRETSVLKASVARKHINYQGKRGLKLVLYVFARGCMQWQPRLSVGRRK